MKNDFRTLITVGAAFHRKCISLLNFESQMEMNIMTKML